MEKTPGSDPLGVDALRADPLGIGAGPARPERPGSPSAAEPRDFFTPFSRRDPGPEPSGPAHDLGGSTETFTSVLFGSDPLGAPRSARPAENGAGSAEETSARPTEAFGRSPERPEDPLTSSTEVFAPSFDSVRPSGGDLWGSRQDNGFEQPAGPAQDLWSRPETSAPAGGSGRPEDAEQPDPPRRPGAFEPAGDGGRPYEDTAEPSRKRRGRRRGEETADAKTGRTTGDPASRTDDPPSEKVVEEEPEQRRMWSPYDEGPRSRRPVYISLGALAFLIAGGVGLAYMASAEPDTSVTAEKPVTETSATPPPGVPNHKDGFAASRATDKHPLTLKEIFPRRKITKGGQTYYMTIRRLDKVCKNGATGEKLQKALTAGKCNQLLRASFRDRSGQIIGTVGVANLNTSKSAKKVVDAAAGSKLEDYVKPLPGKDEHTKSLGTGQANAGAWRHGHYAVLLWFQFKDGHEPSKAERKKLTRAAVNITDATVFPALDSRTLTGRRPE
ncbi:hypothetical protein [Thermostaphylospora chromogena]|uniref:Uncharacterized protein n=1 Tax=Thermostaphylospora chromogena TaxID=35622 RepID=A0A1H1E6W7_9ACTN|nr:hypothetical protein [Thermostaphylospora chromogena]SDQ83886.1 hypothetical protein SAMN04489764_2320 [Thermostaphylospora chromogena]